MRKNAKPPSASKQSISPSPGVGPEEAERILALAEELKPRMNLGERPEDMIDKGSA